MAPHLIPLTEEVSEFLMRSNRSHFGAKADGHCGYESGGVQAKKTVEEMREYIKVLGGVCVVGGRGCDCDYVSGACK